MADIAQNKAMSTAWYFINHENLAPQLYDEKVDGTPLHNLAEKPERKKVVADFLTRVQGTLRRTECLINVLPNKN